MNSCPFPVGFGGFFQTDPSTIYSGTTWEQKKDVFILASGDTYSAGSTGGEAQHILTEAEMPSHTHIPYADGTMDASFRLFMGRDDWFREEAGTSFFRVTATAGATNKGFEAITSPAGEDQPHNNMPPYFAMPFWIRTA